MDKKKMKQWNIIGHTNDPFFSAGGLTSIRIVECPKCKFRFEQMLNIGLSHAALNPSRCKKCNYIEK